MDGLGRQCYVSCSDVVALCAFLIKLKSVMNILVILNVTMVVARI